MIYRIQVKKHISYKGIENRIVLQALAERAGSMSYYAAVFLMKLPGYPGCRHY